ncbi:FliM/FliN family flagellar motor switch protein [bacterium]|nr:FliM/FliN family flagellar motor switch protein [bacterium]
MDNLTEAEVIKTKDFYQKMTKNIEAICFKHLDHDVFKTFEINVNNIEISNNIEKYLDNSLFYSVDYVKGDMQGTLGLLLPEQFVAEISDVIMGGNGENCYEGKLEELQLNTIDDLLKKQIKEFEKSFTETYEKNVAFAPESKILTKERPEFNTALSANTLDFIIEEKVIINGTKTYTLYILLYFSNVKELLLELNILDKAQKPIIADGEGIGIKQLKNVKINITAELGHKEVPIKYAMELVSGSIVELDTVVNQDIRVYANGVEVALAQIVAVEDNFGLKITKILSPEERIRSI